ATVESINCRNEINYSCMMKKEILVVYLEETTLAYGLNLQLNSKQSLFRYRHKENGSFLRELTKAQILAPCHEGFQEGESSFATPSSSSAPAPTYHETLAFESKGKDETILAHQNGPYAIARVGCMGSQDPTIPWPNGTYADEISLNRFSAVQFHCSLLTPEPKSCERELGIRIYNEHGMLVMDKQVRVSFAAGNNKFSIGWRIKDKDGFMQSPGRYMALLWIDDSRVFEYNFTLTRTVNTASAAPASRTKKKRPVFVENAPRLFLYHCIAWILYLICTACAANESMIAAALFLVLGFGFTIFYFIQTRKRAGFEWIVTFFLLFNLGFSFFYGFVLFFAAIIGLCKRLFGRNKSNVI
ncbi:MAG: hypothetical protein J6R89_01750, partial [Clostridia bacterium]|nr:hypothetical protein [Clostridia bacterium]